MRAKGGAAVYWLWLFCLYSFLGYLLEKAFAAATGSRHQVRKCFLLLPLCPVYGLAMLAVLHLPADLRRGFFGPLWRPYGHCRGIRRPLSL